MGLDHANSINLEMRDLMIKHQLFAPWISGGLCFRKFNREGTGFCFDCFHLTASVENESFFRKIPTSEGLGTKLRCYTVQNARQLLFEFGRNTCSQSPESHDLSLRKSAVCEREAYSKLK